MLNGTWWEVSVGSVSVVPPMVMHTVASGFEGVEFMVFTIPAYEPEDSYDLFEFLPEFSAYNPRLVKELPSAEQSTSVEVIELFSTNEWELVCARLASGASVPLHRHEQEESVYFIIEGSGEVTLAGKTTLVEPGSLVSIPRDTAHGIAAGPLGVRFYEVATPPIKERAVK